MTFAKILDKMGYMNTNLITEMVETLTNGLDESIKKAFGNSLKKLREHTGITQIELEEATKVSRQSLSVYERGEVAPTITQAYRIAMCFGLDVSDFIDYGLNLPKEFSDLEFDSITELYDAVNKD